MSRTSDRLSFASAATAALVLPAIVLCPTVSAAPSPGVPCGEIIEHFASSPTALPEVLEGAANSAFSAVPDSTPLLPMATEVPVVAEVANMAPLIQQAAAVGAPAALPPAPAAPIAEAALAPVGPPPGPPLPGPEFAAPAAPTVETAFTPALPVPAAVPVAAPPISALPLPSELSLPRDLVCEGTAWSARAPEILN